MPRGDRSPAHVSAGARPTSVTVEAGAADVVLVAPRGGELSIVLDGFSGPGTRVRRAVLRGTAPGGGPVFHWAEISADGRARFRGLVPDRSYDLLVLPGEDGTYALRSDVAARAGDLEVRLVAGGTIRGRLAMPPGAERPSVSTRLADWGPGTWVQMPGRVGGDGSFEIAGLPPGEYSVAAYARVEGGSVQGMVEHVRAGEETVIRLR